MSTARSDDRAFLDAVLADAEGRLDNERFLKRDHEAWRVARDAAGESPIREVKRLLHEAMRLLQEIEDGA